MSGVRLSSGWVSVIDVMEEREMMWLTCLLDCFLGAALECEAPITQSSQVTTNWPRLSDDLSCSPLYAEAKSWNFPNHGETFPI